MRSYDPGMLPVASVCLPPSTFLVSPLDELGVRSVRETVSCLHTVGVAPSSSGKSTVLQFIRNALMSAISNMKKSGSNAFHDFVFGSGTTAALLRCLAANRGSVLAVADELQLLLGSSLTGAGLSDADMGSFLSVLAGNGFTKATTAGRDSNKTDVVSVSSTNLSSVSMTQPTTFARMVDGDAGACLERGALQRMVPFIVRPVNALVGPADEFRMAQPDLAAVDQFVVALFTVLLSTKLSPVLTSDRSSTYIVLPADSSANIVDIYNNEVRFRAARQAGDGLDMHLSRVTTQRTAKLSVALALLDYAAALVLDTRTDALHMPRLETVRGHLPQPRRRPDGRWQFVDVEVTAFVNHWCTGHPPAMQLLRTLREREGERRAGHAFIEQHILHAASVPGDGSKGVPIRVVGPSANEVGVNVSPDHVRLGNVLAGRRIRSPGAP